MAEVRVGEKRMVLKDVRPYFMFDTISIATANTSTEFYYFRTPEGKTTLETNIQHFSSLPVGWTFDVKKMRLIPNSDISRADLSEIFGLATSQLSTVTYLKDGDTEIFTLPSVMLNAGCGIAGALAGSTDASVVSLGVPSQGAVLNLPFPLTIKGGRTYSFKHRFGAAPTPAVASKITMVLEGILGKEVVGA